MTATEFTDNRKKREKFDMSRKPGAVICADAGGIGIDTPGQFGSLSSLNRSS